MKPAVLYLMLVALSCSVAGCTPELGKAPFLCNNGSPRCPEGYHCESAGGRDVCVRDGASLGDTAPARRDAGVRRDSGKRDAPIARADSFAWPDAAPADVSITPSDSTPQLRDTGTTDLPGHLGCQSNAECKSSSEPCCCPLPLIPGVWGCLPFCFDPFCI